MSRGCNIITASISCSAKGQGSQANASTQDDYIMQFEDLEMFTHSFAFGEIVYSSAPEILVTIQPAKPCF